ncbi:MAG: endonuclease/exonuclease/phosphatase family protein [Patescibacteria group bacterium]
MKLISLNVWGGHEFDALLSFLATHTKSTDIFCFQEVYISSQDIISRGTQLNILKKLRSILPHHRLFFIPIQDNIDENGAISIPSTFGQAMFIHKSLSVEKEGFVFTHRDHNAMEGDDFGTLGSGFQYLQLKKTGYPLIILNIHGNSRPGDKLDTADRLTQVQKIKDFLKNSSGQKIVCGDFNLMPGTQSIRILEENMKNLIKEFAILDTRGKLNARKYPNDPLPQQFGDYIFVSPDINVISFKVPNALVSDHLPLILEYA